VCACTDLAALGSELIVEGGNSHVHFLLLCCQCLVQEFDLPVSVCEGLFELGHSRLQLLNAVPELADEIRISRHAGAHVRELSFEVADVGIALCQHLFHACAVDSGALPGSRVLL
jgi:hypothetical protein